MARRRRTDLLRLAIAHEDVMPRLYAADASGHELDEL
jgi:hypothetical protein